MLVLNPTWRKHAVLAHRSGELHLDNAFTLIEGHRTNQAVFGEGFCLELKAYFGWSASVQLVTRMSGAGEELISTETNLCPSRLTS